MEWRCEQEWGARVAPGKEGGRGTGAAIIPYLAPDLVPDLVLDLVPDLVLNYPLGPSKGSEGPLTLA